ncbi:MAG TPA: RNA-binding transcriptional accessory protein [Candidatus Onthovicinus excrementipullorum]|nr:RNA-binding transcriptional accessory protein [Candidatus Onthovicinus excrementipullorum]
MNQLGEKSIVAALQQELSIQKWQVEAVIKLIDEGNTIPFIARYRKEATGNLNDETLRAFDERLRYLNNLWDRKESVLGSIDEQGKLTDELRAQILAAATLVELEDLYRPYKQKRRTRASIARERGLEPLAELILLQQTQRPLIQEAEAFVDPEKDVPDAQAAIAGAQDIIAEQISDNADYRKWIRNRTASAGILTTTAKDAETSSPYEMYYDFSEPLKRMAGHRVLAVNRGEKEKILSVKIDAPENEILTYLKKRLIRHDNPNTTPAIEAALADAYKRLIAPSIENELRGELTDRAEEGAIRVFAENLKQLLMQPPISGRVVLGWDPAFRTGCKLAVVDSLGKVLHTVVIYPTAPQNKVQESIRTLKQLISKYKIDLISLGNGTASRESERVIVELLRETDRPVQYVVVNEAGASVYSASKLATEEFPTFDVGQRSAVSIARRLQDPMAELVKIDPKSIGVGQYQHDMNQTRLTETLTGVVEDCVNRVGVDLNTASVSLLSYVSGISKPVAKNIVTYREEHGRFQTRRELLKVPKLGPKAFEQCAGFLRIREGKNPLDSTGVHPESYGAAEQLLQKTGHTAADLKHGGIPGLTVNGPELSALSSELGVGEITLRDIIAELNKPGRDPRADMPKPILRSDVLELKDLKPGMVLKGTVRNVIDFGAFVDIGVHQDGLVHISQLADRYVRHPLDVVKIGDIVDVKVLDVDPVKKKISLTMRGIKAGK